MAKEVTIKIEIGDNLRNSINKLIEAVVLQNARCRYAQDTVSIGHEVKKAFDLDVKKLTKAALINIKERE